MTQDIIDLRHRLGTSIWAIPALICLVSLGMGLLMLWRHHVRVHHDFLIAASGNGYVQSVDYDGLVGWCKEHNCYLQILTERHDSSCRESMPARQV
jgi:uncharacterized membrane protein